MDKSIAKRILKLNKDFYQSHGGSFSESRKKPWEGWTRVLDQINEIKRSKLMVLDLGSGNARFYDYLKNNFKGNLEYLGLDQSDNLIKIAAKKYSGNSNFKQKRLDVITDLDKIDGLYDVVVAFGLTHHIPSDTIRKDWFGKIGNLVSKGGFLILTFWRVEKPLEQKARVMRADKLDPGDAFLGWKRTKGATRFVHLYSELEINDVIDIQTQLKIQLKQKFISDRSKKTSNLYLIFKKG